jgi:hypothetical protein
VEAPCPRCDSPLLLRLPKGVEDGTFSVDCQDCGKNIEVDISITSQGRERIRINGKLLRGPREPKPEKVEVKEEAVLVKEEKVPNYHRRTRIAFILLVIVGILGIISSIVTVTSSFTIRDLEDQSPNETSTFSLWAIDSETGRSIGGVDVILTSGGYSKSGTTDQEGLVVMNDVRTGVVDIELKHPDYRTTRGEVVITKGSPNVIDVPMVPGSPTDIEPLPLEQFRSPRYSSQLTSITGLVMFISSLFGLVAAFFVRSREFFTLAVIAGFLSLFSFGFLVGTILAIVSLVLVITSYRGFSHNYQLKMLLEEQGREDLKHFFKSQRGPPLGLPPAEDVESWD